MIICGDALEVLAGLPEGSVHCVVTSPPYWGLRDYGTATWEGGDPECDHIAPRSASDEQGEEFCKRGEERGYAKGSNFANYGARQTASGTIYAGTCGKCGARRIDNQLGLEKTPEEYVAKMVEVFRAVRRALRDDGTLWLNLGDSYFGGGGYSPDSPSNQKDEAQSRGQWRPSYHDAGVRQKPKGLTCPGLKPKDLCGIPWRVAFALQADGWYLRSDIIWAKPNPMPESVTDRPTKSHEYLFLLTKAKSYFYDAEAIKEAADVSTQRSTPAPNVTESVGNTGGNKRTDFEKNRHTVTSRNRRSVWTIPTAPYPEAHFATFPPALVEPCIKAGTSEKGCCPECGKPWERIVEKSRTFQSGSGRAGNMPVGKNGPDLQGGGETMDVRRGPCVEAHTIGWRPGCECYGLEIIEDQLTKGRDEKKAEFEARLNEWQTRWETLSPQYTAQVISPCLVLDPFGGSGTVGMVAAQLGQRYVHIDLSEEYCAMARERIGSALAPETFTKANLPPNAPLFPQEAP